MQKFDALNHSSDNTANPEFAGDNTQANFKAWEYDQIAHTPGFSNDISSKHGFPMLDVPTVFHSTVDSPNGNATLADAVRGGMPNGQMLETELRDRLVKELTPEHRAQYEQESMTVGGQQYLPEHQKIEKALIAKEQSISAIAQIDLTPQGKEELRKEFKQYKQDAQEHPGEPTNMPTTLDYYMNRVKELTQSFVDQHVDPDGGPLDNPSKIIIGVPPQDGHGHPLFTPPEWHPSFHPRVPVSEQIWRGAYDSNAQNLKADQIGEAAYRAGSEFLNT